MELDGNSLLASLLVSTLGFGIFLYGKRQTRIPQLIGGLLMMVFPYFVSNPWLILGIGAVLVASVVGASKVGL